MTPWTKACQAPLTRYPLQTISWSLLKFMSIESVMLSNHFILCHPLLLWPSIFPVSGTFSMRWLITSGGQNIGASTPTSVLPINVQSWFCLGLTDLLFMQSKRLSRVPCILDYQASTKYFLTQSTMSILLIIVSPAPQFKSINSLASVFFGSLIKQESSRKTSISALLTMLKPLTVWVTINCGKCWKRWEYQTTWPAFWEICMQVRKQQLELDMEQQSGSK